MLTEEFLKPLGLTEYRLAKDIAVPPRRINEIVHGRRAITTDTAFRLSQYFGNSPQFWLNLQADYELRRMERAGELPKRPSAFAHCIGKSSTLPLCPLPLKPPAP